MARQSRLSFATTTPRKADKAPDAAGLALMSRERGTLIASRKRDAPSESTSSQLSATALALSQSDMDSTFELPDSTDWHATSLPAFEPLEAALRCEVCKEFYDNPVITSCSHTFCSICIRRCISTDGKCPTCKTLSQADKLVPNYAVREIVNKFQDARPKALDLARQNKDESDATSESKKRKLADTDMEEGEHARQTRSRQTMQSQRGTGSNGMPFEVPDSEDDGDETFDPEMESMVKCPVCGEPMLEAQVFRHLDTCTGESAGRKTRSRYVVQTAAYDER
jgi:E3 ubiquitin-protein ligase RAD18